VAALDHVGHALYLAGVGACLPHQRARLLNARGLLFLPLFTKFLDCRFSEVARSFVDFVTIGATAPLGNVRGDLLLAGGRRSRWSSHYRRA
jgi:hypothetical protein